MRGHRAEVVGHGRGAARKSKLVEVLGRTTEPEQFKAAIDGLWASVSERGSENKAKLEAVDRLISEGEASQWVEASEAARKLAEEHDDWPEALNRLATVEYLRGEYDTSVELCKKVLAAKIHHFGALSGICMCYQKLGDEDALAEWRERMLPNDPSARRWADERSGRWTGRWMNVCVCLRRWSLSRIGRVACFLGESAELGDEVEQAEARWAHTGAFRMGRRGRRRRKAKAPPRRPCCLVCGRRCEKRARVASMGWRWG